MLAIIATGQQSNPQKSYIKSNPGILKKSSSNEVIPLNYQQLKTRILNLSVHSKFNEFRFDQNDISAIIYGLTFIYFLTDGIYSIYAGYSDYDKKHFITPYDDSTKNFFFKGGLSLLMIGIATILCTDQFGCIPGRRIQNY
ncbi:MAG: hypothetical protein K9H84_07100 [Bacteroidales bacterium]|nr:hypothetical protein [Bacteroidales bacterium]